MESVQPIQGIVPSMVWEALAVLIVAAGLYVLYGQVRKTHRQEQNAKQEKQANGDVTIKEQLENITKQLDEISAFMKETNERFNRDDQRLKALETEKAEMLNAITDVKNGVRALCQSSLAHLSHDITGNHVESLKKAEGIVNDYLTDRLQN